ncbi:NAD-dependent deacetylase [Chitinophaga costaii]|uniref:protein acetyllysine N-acetyltransferase n=1 Tax=Chitinophaga costaii TaxID=1335309 RepID=A0A1C4FDM9_9BACT|nr:Sir2 family NAD-dependent protein deacetylase [Chitinophaga costaii]PUZ20648.1 NAD-dependent protein deacylase [Chitinophaga costaii]SCC54127.1 NAD-dependent deacetylase [Chitinophaga costaii]
MKLKLVVLTGAGISAESGLRTFRDMDGLWEGYDVYEVASQEGWNKNPQQVLDFYNARRHDVRKALPNAAHTGLAKLEEKYDVRIITQNIDDLHERGGSSNVLHLHGEITKTRSVRNEHQTYPYVADIHLGNLAADGGQLRPFIVWFGEEVPLIEKAVEEVMQADIFVIIGTSLAVYPAAGLLDVTRGNIPKYLIDKNISAITGFHQIKTIALPATLGVQQLIKELM